jgi:hypothetical protein
MRQAMTGTRAVDRFRLDAVEPAYLAVHRDIDRRSQAGEVEAARESARRSGGWRFGERRGSGR